MITNSAENAQKTPKLSENERTKCEIWSRVMGYYRATSMYNKGKQSEYKDRKYFDKKESINDRDKQKPL